MDKITLAKYFSRLIILLVAIPVHESAHALASLKLGDPTARDQGRLTLNPMAHFDLIGSLSLLFFGIGWAKPVPIDPRYYSNRKMGMALSALAGPVSNLLMALLSMIAAKILGYAYYASGAVGLYYVWYVFYYMTIINISLGIFNLLPVPPFDGSRIMLLFLPERAYFSIMRYERYIFLALFMLLWLGVLDGPLATANTAVYNALDYVTGFVDSVARALN